MSRGKLGLAAIIPGAGAIALYNADHPLPATALLMVTLTLLAIARYGHHD